MKLGFFLEESVLKAERGNLSAAETGLIRKSIKS